MRRILLPVIVLFALVGGGAAVAAALTVLGDSGPAASASATNPSAVASPAQDPLPDDETADVAAAAGTVVVHRSETCGCCGGHVEHLVEAGFHVEEVVTPDGTAVEELKIERGVPEADWSCHTTLVGGYAVEGHVPAGSIARLLQEAPDLDGVALAGMPAGSPGMPGEQEEPFDVTGFVDGQTAGTFVEG